MREILFRGKSINSGEWIEGMTISKGTIKRKMNSLFIEIGENKWVGIIPESLGQFTGLTDKNGNKIFEGDILGGINSGDYIKWCDKCKSFEVFSANEYCYSCEHDFFWCDLVEQFEENNLEIIGNCIDNPDLLN